MYIYILIFGIYFSVDATYKPWGAWGACSQTCGDATQTRSRECIEQKHGGKSCKELADDGQLATDTRACNDGDCPSRSLFYLIFEEDIKDTCIYM